MWIRQAGNFLESRLAPLTSVVGKIGAAAIVVMMLITVIDIVGRRVFNEPLSGSYELSEFMLVIVVFFSIVHCEFLRAHVTVEVITSRLRKSTQDIISAVMYVFFLVTFILLTQQLIVHSIDSSQTNLTSGILKIPVYPYIALAAFSSFLVSLVVLAHLLLYTAEALKK